MLSYKKISKIKNVKTEYILKNYLPFPLGTVGMIASRGGVGKTLSSINLAMKYVQESKLKGENKKCACWFSEDDDSTIKNRALSLIKGGIHDDLKDIDDVLIINEEVQNVLKVGFQGVEINKKLIIDLHNFIVEENIGFLILDPLIAFYGGDENNNSQAKLFMQQFVNLCNELNINILFLHHAKKGDTNETRGAGAFTDAIRTLYEIDYPKVKVGRNIEIDKELYKKGVRSFTLKKDNRNVISILNKIRKEEITTNMFNYQVLPHGVFEKDLDEMYDICDDLFGKVDETFIDKKIKEDDIKSKKEVEEKYKKIMERIKEKIEEEIEIPF